MDDNPYKSPEALTGRQRRKWLRIAALVAGLFILGMVGCVGRFLYLAEKAKHPNRFGDSPIGYHRPSRSDQR